MHLRPLLLLPALLTLSSTQAQSVPYRSAGNPYYWAEQPPYAGYWQQDVHYRMDVRLDEQRNTADGTVKLTYRNNSPDTLHDIFLHLYQEAFNADSHYDRLRRAQGQRGADPARNHGTELHTLRVAGSELRREQDNTIVRAWLPAPLLPGDSLVLDYSFTTHWGGMRRMKLVNVDGHKHFDGCHWYPRISVYDRKFGWDTQQHLNHELYGDFGTFDVALDMPNDMVVEATGVLQNEQEVLPPDLRARLDIGNFKDKPWNEPAGVITPYVPGERKVWRYHAQNVHDFAFTADPTYRIGETIWNGVHCISVAQERHAAKWQNAAEYCMRSIKALSELVGMYAYPKMVVADAFDGMEYPMLTLDSDQDPGYRDLLVHEIAHNWFYGMVGNNETYRAMLDEGFTQFYTAKGLIHIDGDTLVADTPRTAYERRYTTPDLVMERSAYAGYMRDAIRNTAPPVNVHSDEFGYFNNGYRHVYYRTAVMLYNLEYVLGEELFAKAMQGYFERWRMKHPYIEDFRQTVTDITKVDLNWFFDQWIETDKRTDYAVVGVKRRGRDAGQVIRFRRKGSMQMPIDFTVVARDGGRHDFHIPNTWFVKRTAAKVLPRWTGFDELQREHSVLVDIPSGIADVLIDTSYRLADTYQLDNSLRLPASFTFDHHLDRRNDRRNYEGFGRPDLWWNGYDGIKVGFHFNGGWMRYKHRLHATAWLNTGIGQYLPPRAPNTIDSIPGNADTGFDPISFNLVYDNGTERLLKGSSVYLMARHLDGLQRYGGGFHWDMPDRRTSADARLLYFMRRDSAALTYLLDPTAWELDRLNGVLDLNITRTYEHRGTAGRLLLDLRNSAVGSASAYGQVRLTSMTTTRFVGLELRSRIMGQFGTGATPRESALYLAGASPEEMMENKYVRSIGFVPYEWTGTGASVNHFHQGGGLCLRGYAGYLAPEMVDGDSLITTWYGNSGAAINVELDLDQLVRFRPGKLASYLHLDVYLFGDVGSMGYRSFTSAGGTRLELAAPRADAGLGAALTIKRFGPLKDIKPLTVRFDMPLFLSHLPATEQEHLAFRYVIGIGRTF